MVNFDALDRLATPIPLVSKNFVMQADQGAIVVVHVKQLSCNFIPASCNDCLTFTATLMETDSLTLSLNVA